MLGKLLVLGVAAGAAYLGARRLIDAVATVLFWALVLPSVLGVLLAPAVVWLMASGLAEFDAATVMTRLMFPYIVCMSMVALSAPCASMPAAQV